MWSYSQGVKGAVSKQLWRLKSAKVTPNKFDAVDATLYERHIIKTVRTENEITLSPTFSLFLLSETNSSNTNLVRSPSSLHDSTNVNIIDPQCYHVLRLDVNNLFDRAQKNPMSVFFFFWVPWCMNCFTSWFHKVPNNGHQPYTSWFWTFLCFANFVRALPNYKRIPLWLSHFCVFFFLTQG